MLKFLRDISWEEIFENWRKREAQNPGWIKCATEIKGWPDWESWRKFSASQISADKRMWKLFEFTDPFNDIPSMIIGPYSGWQKRVPEKNTYSFEELLSIQENYSFFKEHDGVIKIMNGFPFPTELIGLIRDDGRIVCIEGHHRATAIAFAKKEGKNMDFKNSVHIALAQLTKDESGFFDKILGRGTSKIQKE